jgi:hypothetical protein
VAIELLGRTPISKAGVPLAFQLQMKNPRDPGSPAVLGYAHMTHFLTSRYRFRLTQNHVSGNLADMKKRLSPENEFLLIIAIAAVIFIIAVLFAQSGRDPLSQPQEPRERIIQTEQRNNDFTPS